MRRLIGSETCTWQHIKSVSEAEDELETRQSMLQVLAKGVSKRFEWATEMQICFTTLVESEGFAEMCDGATVFIRPPTGRRD